MLRIFGFVFLSMFSTSEKNISELVKEFHLLDSKESEFLFIQKNEKDKDPSVLAYVHALKMKQATYTINPILKLKIFNRNKNILNRLILDNAQNIHLRYIRLMLQESLPSFLGFDNFISEDKAFLKLKLEIKDETDYLDKFINENTSL
ncbi:hypothetical protein ACFLSU_05820 [Bacteroidota bacterium]